MFSRVNDSINSMDESLRLAGAEKSVKNVDTRVT